MKTTDIPRSTNDDGWTDTIDAGDGYAVRVRVEYDQDYGAPWEEHDGHGPVSDWRPLDSKQPGERVLNVDHRSARFYDFAEAVKIARRDHWGFKGQYTFDNGKRPQLTDEARKMTPKARAARAAEEDYELMRAWSNDEWHWITVGVEVSHRGEVIDTDYCGGIEDYTDYWREHAADVATYAIDAHKRKRASLWRAALHEARERRHWAARDVVTTRGKS